MASDGQLVYDVSVNSRFASHVFSDDKRFSTPERAEKIADERSKEPERYLGYRLDRNALQPFFQQKYVNRLAGNIAKANYGEEIVFEQMLITDNLNRDDLLIVDRQVTGGTLRNKRLDLLALEQVDGNKYRFLALELKLGCNKELSDKVGPQIQYYVDSLTSGFEAWKGCYEECYRQLRATGVFCRPSYAEIEIVLPVVGRVIVMGYSQAGQAAIRELRQGHPKVQVQQFVCKI
jgi:hypothetical protein